MSCPPPDPTKPHFSAKKIAPPSQRSPPKPRHKANFSTGHQTSCLALKTRNFFRQRTPSEQIDPPSLQQRPHLRLCKYRESSQQQTHQDRHHKTFAPHPAQQSERLNADRKGPRRGLFLFLEPCSSPQKNADRFQSAFSRNFVIQLFPAPAPAEGSPRRKAFPAQYRSRRSTPQTSRRNALA